MAIQLADRIVEALEKASNIAKDSRTDYVTPEHLLKAMLEQAEFNTFCLRHISSPKAFVDALDLYIRNNTTGTLTDGSTPEYSYQLNDVLDKASHLVRTSGATAVDAPHVVYGLISLNESQAKFLLSKHLGLSLSDFVDKSFKYYNHEEDKGDNTVPNNTEWKQFGYYIDKSKYDDTPIIGRDMEVSRAIMIMSRKEKNNPMFVGENGVGKNAIVNSIAARLATGSVPERLKGKKIFTLDMASVVAGTQFRGDMEKRLKDIMEGVKSTRNTIVFIDNTHDVIGAGRGNDSVMDATSIIMPYMQNQSISFIGATSCEDYKKSITRNKNFERMFQKIDVEEPSADEAKAILRGLKEKYENYHHVIYSDEVIDYAVDSSIRYINDRFLPEKAIDLLDEAGAYREMHKLPGGMQIVDIPLVKEILSKVCNIDLTEKKDADIFSLKDTIQSRIFGQQSAVDAVCEAVLTAKAGLSDPLKPMASFLFVGPTGVGKTQLAKELAVGMNIQLKRFDMSEYSEKNTVTKFIGAPAGYVGYEEGGQLTDAVRKNPNCVLLLDEIEKAHPDIFNLMLQIMDYGTLSDAKGQKADFRNTIIIMTSNAGARYAKRSSIGFNGQVNAGGAMSKEVKNVFAPEFINRLSATVIFNDMSREMALEIAEAKLGDLRRLLEAKDVEMNYTHSALDKVVDLGFTPEYGARELERVISSQIKPLFVREILFGSLKNGGSVMLEVEENEFKLNIK